MKLLTDKEYKSFEQIKNIREDGTEFWYARELSKVLQYVEWRNFIKVINKAKIACENSGKNLLADFVEVNKIVEAGVLEKKIIDYELSRYACYLIVQNGDPKKEVIALAQTYFAIQTRKQEISEKEYSMLTEDEKRIYNRNLTRKGLRYREDILDNMGSDELIVNLFRISQTEQSLKREQVKTENKANKTHYNIGKNIREVIAKNGGTMPEDLLTPKKSLKELEKEKNLVSKN